MDERVLSFRVGVVVVTAATITVILIILFGAVPQVFTRTYSVKIRFPRAPGVAVNSPVRKSGVTIGRVSEVELLAEGGVLLTLRMEKDKPVRLNEYPRISTGSLVTGDAVIEFVRNEADPNTDLLKNDDFLPNGQVVQDPFEVLVGLEGKMSSAFTSIEDAAKRASVILENLEWVGTDRDRIESLLRKTETALEGFSRAMASVDAVLGDEQLQQQLRQTLNEVPQLFADARSTLQQTQETLKGFDRVTASAAQNLTNLEKLTEPLAESSEAILKSVENSAASLDSLLLEIRQLVSTINQGEGTLGKLVYEDDVYRKLNAAVDNVQEVTERLRPIVNDVRVFTDKIARDPRQLGVRGALDRRPTGLKAGINLD